MTHNSLHQTICSWLVWCRSIAFVLAGLGCTAPVWAMTLETQGNIVFATGQVEDDYTAFEVALKNPAVDTVVFVNSPGGDLWTGMRVGRMIASRNLTTVTAGHCVSACSIMFMGGAHRVFADNFSPTQTYVGIHGPASRGSGQLMANHAPQMYAFFKNQMGDKFNSVVINKSLYEMDDAGSLLRIYDMQRSSEKPPVHCRSAQTPPRECTLFWDQSASSLGIVTRPELVQVTLPRSMVPVLRLLGHLIDQPFPALSAFLSDIVDKRCRTPVCKSTFASFENAKPFSAVVLPLEGPGLSWLVGGETTSVAFARAMSTCNFPPAQPVRLCEGYLLNGKSLRALYTNEKALHEKAISELIVPPQKFYGSEEWGGNFTRADGLRAKNFFDITPQSIPDVTTVGTQALAIALKSTRPPQVVDVRGTTGQTIPTARVLLDGGWATDVTVHEERLTPRFESLMRLLAPQLGMV